MIAVVIPSNRPDSLERWTREWTAQFEARPDCRVYVVRDEPETWAAIRERLGAAAWIIPVQTDCIRAYGYWQAWCDGAETILTMDDDCYPDATQPDWLATHEEHLRRFPAFDPSWGTWVSTAEGIRPRGLPHTATRPTGISMGGWSGVPDLDGETQLAVGDRPWFSMYHRTVPKGVFFPMSGMNLAWRRVLTPLMYFGLFGSKITDPTQSWGVHRYGDIWCGVLAKHICDHLGFAVHIGQPIVRHERASNATRNAELEATAKHINEWLWTVVRDIPLTAATPLGCLREVADGLDAGLRGRPEPSPEYWTAWTDALRTWADLFEKET